MQVFVLMIALVSKFVLSKCRCCDYGLVISAALFAAPALFVLVFLQARSKGIKKLKARRWDKKYHMKS